MLASSQDSGLWTTVALILGVMGITALIKAWAAVSRWLERRRKKHTRARRG